MTTGPKLKECVPSPCEILPFFFQSSCNDYIKQLNLTETITLGQLYAVGYEIYNLGQGLLYGIDLPDKFSNFRKGLGDVVSNDLSFWLERLVLGWVAPWLIVISVLLCFLLIYQVINMTTFLQLLGLNLVAGIFAYVWILSDTRNQVNKLGNDIGKYISLSLQQFRLQLEDTILNNVALLSIDKIKNNIPLIINGKDFIGNTNNCKFCDGDISYCVIKEDTFKNNMLELDNFLQKNNKEFFSQ